MAEATTTTYEFELEPGRTVAFRELTVAEFESARKQMRGADGKLDDWELTQQCLRLCLVRDGAEKLDYQKLTGALLAQRFKMKHLLLINNAWNSVHMPSDEDLARVRGMRVIAA